MNQAFILTSSVSGTLTEFLTTFRKYCISIVSSWRFFISIMIALPPFLTPDGSVKLTCHRSASKSCDLFHPSEINVAFPCSDTDDPAHGCPTVTLKFCSVDSLMLRKETLVLARIEQLRLSRGATWLGCWKPKSKNASKATDMKPIIDVSQVLPSHT